MRFDLNEIGFGIRFFELNSGLTGTICCRMLQEIDHSGMGDSAAMNANYGHLDR